MENEINKALEILQFGGVILYPTETVWGIGCDATNEAAVQLVHRIKKRDANKSMILLLDDDRNLKRYVKEIPEVAWDLLDFSVKPTTIIYPEGVNLPKSVCADDGTVAIRITTSPFCQKLISRLKRPIISTSANFSGEPTPTSFEDISSKLKEAVDHVVDLPNHKLEKEPSSIIKLGLTGEVAIIRK